MSNNLNQALIASKVVILSLFTVSVFPKQTEIRRHGLDSRTVFNHLTKSRKVTEPLWALVSSSIKIRIRMPAFVRHGIVGGSRGEKSVWRASISESRNYYVILLKYIFWWKKTTKLYNLNCQNIQKQLERFKIFVILLTKETLIILWSITAKCKSYGFIFLKKISVAFEWIIAKNKGAKEVQNGKKHWQDQGKVESFLEKGYDINETCRKKITNTCWSRRKPATDSQGVPDVENNHEAERVKRRQYIVCLMPPTPHFPWAREFNRLCSIWPATENTYF